MASTRKAMRRLAHRRGTNALRVVADAGVNV